MRLIVNIGILLLIASSCVSFDNTGSGYQRSFFGGWQDLDKDCQNTRHEVLIRDSLRPVTFHTARRCQVKTGHWISPYTGKHHYESRYLDIDHLVPLKEAYVSGAEDWGKDRRVRFANDMSGKQLVVVERSLNRSKGASDPAEWLPPINRCEYIMNWLAIKAQYGLKLDQKENRAITALSKKCREPVK